MEELNYGERYRRKVTSSNCRRILAILCVSSIIVTLRRQAILMDRSLPRNAGGKNTDDIPAHFVDPSVQSSLVVEKENTQSAKRKWAYAFVVGGCSEEKPEYRGFIWNIAVAAQVLQEAGSKADVVALIQMSARTNKTVLPDDESKLLEAMNVKVEYIPKFSSMIHEVFYTLMLEKFRILQMTQYSRVIFMDGDVMPLCSLDYLFELSEPESGEPLLKDNIVISYTTQPAHGGFFMLHPQVGDYEEIQKIIKTTEEKADSLPPVEHWDEVEGWGHRIEPPDRWISQRSAYSSTKWSWHGVHADQGLLYHWTKYVKKSVTLIVNHQVQNWGRAANGSSIMEKEFMNLDSDAPINAASSRCVAGLTAPYCDFQHFTGRGKPWTQNYTFYKIQSEEQAKDREEMAQKFHHLVTSLNKGNRHSNEPLGIRKRHIQEHLSAHVQLVPPQANQPNTPGSNKKVSHIEFNRMQHYVKWFTMFDKVQRLSGVNITFSEFTRGPPVGTHPKYKERIRHIRWKMEHGWNPYVKKELVT